eukprot:2665526-Pleurochrysis_carterae.AAC.1
MKTDSVRFELATQYASALPRSGRCSDEINNIAGSYITPQTERCKHPGVDSGRSPYVYGTIDVVRLRKTSVIQVVRYPGERIMLRCHNMQYVRSFHLKFLTTQPQ